MSSRQERGTREEFMGEKMFFKSGQTIRVLGQDGKMQDGWLVQGYDKKSGKVIIMRLDETGYVEVAQVAEEKLKEWQQ